MATSACCARRAEEEIMTTRRLVWALTIAAAVWPGAAPRASAQESQTVTVPFSDPSRPGRLVMSVSSGSITITGENRQDVVIETRQGADDVGPGRGTTAAPTPPPPGLRRLTQSVGFTVDEENNEMKVGLAGAYNRTLNFTIRVPARTNLKLNTLRNGSISVQSVEGDLETSSMGGSVTLTNVSGSVVANSMRGSVKATLARVTAEKPMAFTSFNGSVDVTFPATIKANFKLRSDGGDVFTDFDIQLRPVPKTDTGDRKGGRFRLEVNNSVLGSVNGGGPEIELRTFHGDVFVRKGP
jgi:hypothetical protein